MISYMPVKWHAKWCKKHPRWPKASQLLPRLRVLPAERVVPWEHRALGPRLRMGLHEGVRIPSSTKKTHRPNSLRVIRLWGPVQQSRFQVEQAPLLRDLLEQEVGRVVLLRILVFPNPRDSLLGRK